MPVRGHVIISTVTVASASISRIKIRTVFVVFDLWYGSLSGNITGIDPLYWYLTERVSTGIYRYLQCDPTKNVA